VPDDDANELDSTVFSYLLSTQSFAQDEHDSVLVPVVEVTSEGYAKYRATGGAGHQAWEDLLPLGDLHILLLMGSYSPGTESGATSKCVIHDDTTCLPASPINVKGHMQVVEARRPSCINYIVWYVVVYPLRSYVGD
jgi:hypothetical protein